MHPIRSLLSLTALSALALAAVVPHNCRDTNNQVSAAGESLEQAAGLARNLVKNTNVGTFMTVMNSARQEGRLEGYPFGSMDYYVDDCDQPGTPLMLLSSLQINIKNAETNNKVSLAIRKLPAEGEKGNPMVDPRVTLMGHLVPVDKEKHARAEACFVAKHPEAKWWLPGAGFHDFKWYNMEIDDIYYIGGFGGIHYIGWIDVATYYGADNLSSTKLMLDEADLESLSSSLLLQRQ
ncbi:heme iron utilization protein [Entomortierella parvispora]|uniref:Heme iron utilization protein n=1 Tax=Entomortierella parvispora TaxID=205924 RepID=A0A9P3H0W1_9FUNG|nr:heme iron utilization protein [Entomortierella parvispora]